MKRLVKLCALSLLSAAIVAAPTFASAQVTNKHAAKPTTEDKPAKGKKAGGHPFHGKLAEVDKVAKTITVGKSTYQITSETKIKKGDKPATLEDGVIGEPVSGYVKSNADGKVVATSVTFGSKSPAKNESKSENKPAKNAPANANSKSTNPS